MPRLRKTLPKDLEDLYAAAAESGDDTSVRAALERCEPDARGGYAKGTALSIRGCTPAIAKWAIARGTDVNAGDTYGRAPLHHVVTWWKRPLDVDELVALGADPYLRCEYERTALHYAVDSQKQEPVVRLMAHGVDVHARDNRGHTALEHGLIRLTNIGMPAMLPVVDTLLAAGAEVTDTCREAMRKAAERFEFHRASFAAESVDEVAAAMEAICGRLNVEPPSPRRMHDGHSPIVATAATWQKQHAELWDLLVPSRGPAATAQGEVIRITGRISDELHRNGGGNWDADYGQMTTALVEILGSGRALDAVQIDEARQVVRAVRQQPDGCRRLIELAVSWVAGNPEPVALPPPAYRR